MGLQYEHYDVATNEAARDHLKMREIKSLPVTIVDQEQVIIGYYPKKLIPALNLKVSVDLSVKMDWLSDKYNVILSAAVRATHQLSDSQLAELTPWRDWTLGEVMRHVMSFPELAWRSHTHGSMSTDDMQASDERLRDVTTVETLAPYGESVRQSILEFLRSGDNASFDRVVPAHYGGEVTVLELLNIVLSQHPSPEADLLAHGNQPGRRLERSGHGERLSGHRDSLYPYLRADTGAGEHGFLPAGLQELCSQRLA